LRHLRRVIVAVIGVTVLAIGVAMIILPGPAMVVIPLGLGILAIEFAWARRMLERLKREGSKVFGRK
jgi:tellurite resistance protein TerC